MNVQSIFSKEKMGLLTLRGVSILAKFVFTALFFQLSEAQFGEYSLVATTILLLVFVLGLDFYSYANRAVMTPETNTQKIIFNQFSLYGILYLLLIPLVYIIFNLAKFDYAYLYLFYAVLVTEHLNFEFYRLLFVFKKPLQANINLFLRNGLWVLFASWQMYVYKEISIAEILWYWFIGNAFALIYTLIIIIGKRYKIDTQNFKWDKQWIKTGLLVSVPYILATLAYKTIEFSDRYMIDYFLDKKQVGIYSFFANMANVLNIVLFTIVISMIYPKMVTAIMEKNQPAYQKYFKRMKKETVFYAAGVSVFLAIMLPIILMAIHKDIYLKQFYVFFLLILGNFFLNLSFVYHFVIYAQHKDWQIFKATAWAAIANVLLNLLLIPLLGIAGAALATLVSFLIILLIKYKDARNFSV